MPALSSDFVALALLVAASGCGPYDVLASGRDLGCETERWACDGDLAVQAETGLQWDRRAPSRELEWDEALESCAALSLGGRDDWRVPTLEELTSIREGSLSPRIDLGVFPGTEGGWFWASEAFNAFSAGAVDFASEESADAREKTERAFVRCVR